MNKSKDRKLLEDLHLAVTNYFNAENNFRRNASEKTWDAKKEADTKMIKIMSRVGIHLKQNDYGKV